MSKNIIFSGIQPTGQLHLGNYLGAVKQWAELQYQYSSIFCIVDYHAMTVPYAPKELSKKIVELALDLLAAGLNSDKSIVFVQSHVAEHTELAWIFNTITPLGELERMTQFKEKSEQHKQSVNAGLFTYPVLQAADVLLYKADTVPVGEDQVQHIELMRVIARKFNAAFGKTFPEPKPLLTKTPRIMSLVEPEVKMSKSKGDKHYIALTDSPSVIRAKVKSAVTDTARGADAPGVTNLFALLSEFGAKATVDNLVQDHKNGTLKYSTLKEVVAEAIIKHLEPIQEKRASLAKDKDKIAGILLDGAERARAIAKKTMEEVRKKIGVR